MQRISEEEIARRLAENPEWGREDGKWIGRKYRFSAFKDAMAFVNEVAELAEAMNHHPLIAIDYKVVTLRLTTWHSGGLTRLDFEAASAYDRIYGERRPGGS